MTSSDPHPFHPPPPKADDPVLEGRIRQLFRFYDRDGGGVHTLAEDCEPVAMPWPLPPDRLPRAVFLELVEQLWFDPSPTAPGRLLFGCV